MNAAETAPEVNLLHEQIAALRPQVLKRCLFWYRHYPNTMELAEDAAQETIIRALRNSGSFRQDASLPTWLFQVCRNCLIDRYRRRDHRYALACLDDIMDEDLPNFDPMASILAKDRLRTALRLLGPNERTALTLLACGFSYEESAARMGLHVNYFKTKVHKARRRLALLAQVA